MKKNVLTREKESKLEAIAQSRPREPMPRPVVFRNKKKYSRADAKKAVRDYVL